MAKRFVTRSRQEWEALLATNAEPHEVRASARQWLASRLEGYTQAAPDALIVLAVPARFLEMLGDVPETAPSGLPDRQRGATRRERRVR